MAGGKTFALERARMAKIGKTALVAGRSMAGLAAAAALSKHFDKVTILDKDPPTDRAEARAGVGQGHHVHVLLKSGEQSIERLLPGTCEKLVARGAVPIRMSVDTCIYDHGQWLPRRDLGYRNLSASRPAIEQSVLQQLMLRPQVELRHETTVESLSFGSDGGVDGLRVRSTNGSEEIIHADLVVDCTGRLSRTREDLQAGGYEVAHESKLKIGISYTSAFFETPGSFSEEYGLLVIQPTAPLKRGAFIAKTEGGRWLVSLHTRFEKELPTSQDEMSAFARDIEAPEVANFLDVAKIQGPVRSYRKLEATWRRYDKPERFPEGLLALGDATASFNPIFGQGMSVAWLQASALDQLLEARSAGDRGLSGLGADYFPLAAQISREAWNGSTLVDSEYDDVSGDRRPGNEQRLLYMRALRTLLHEDPELHADYIGAGQLLVPNSVLTREDRRARVMAAAARL
jgi:2-polyprenyl-6-methoxyphenol hydroxylase-like FAD-dependent oxidoreductase